MVDLMRGLFAQAEQRRLERMGEGARRLLGVPPEADEEHADEGEGGEPPRTLDVDGGRGVGRPVPAPPPTLGGFVKASIELRDKERAELARQYDRASDDERGS